MNDSNESRTRSDKIWYKNNYNWTGFLMLPHLLTNFEIQRYYQNKPKFNGIFSKK